ncbi:hypothetical protein HOT49_gp124 [Erwinia phage vB_EamM_Alexandra]|uniref:Uncharacterized protein n=1 Tax=Erwinia phage vB_EamM_Alexandra TaxID=2201424 RepID=A0A2Z4QDT0_9CAUD|nr:hypothetical protein HOT49_gp124 [Erwinia phage vB_EamM_Alexandra]AWY08398.1 hypothetical protein Alexandra_126 [Erwinia phage vB_EamM_Alexandra]
MTFDVYCSRKPTHAECERIHQLMQRTMKKVGKPFFAHTLVITGAATSQAMAALSHIGCNVSTRPPKHRIKHAVVIGGPAPSDFMKNRRQVLICPED